METTERPGSATEIEQRIEEIDQLIQEIEDVLAEPKPHDLRPENEDELRTTQNQLARDRVYLDESLNRRMGMTNITDFVGEYVPHIEAIQAPGEDELAVIDHEAIIQQDEEAYGPDHVDFAGQTLEERREAVRAARIKEAMLGVKSFFAA